MVIKNKSNIEKLQIEYLILEKSIRITEEISRLLYKTQALSVVVIQEHGDVHDFESIASTIIANDPAVMNVLLAPDGIVSQAYPLEGNEAVIGWNYFGAGAGNKEALESKELGTLVMAGPFATRQGGEALAGRMPVYIDTPAEKQQFWGFVSVTLKFPMALENTKLETLKDRGFVYELWRINPDTGEKQVLASSLWQSRLNRGSVQGVEGKINIFHAEWNLKIWPIRLWYSYPENLILVVVGLLICFLVLFVMQNNHELRHMKAVFEKMANIDPVTGICNRRYMDENLRRVIGSLSRSNGTLSLLMIDVDLFKNYNDVYGHSKGDTCLRIIAQTLVNSLLRADDFVARYGGEEFAVVLPNTSENGARMVADRLLESIQHRKIAHEASNVANHITISIGVTTGVVQHTYTGDDFIKRADKALYMSKQNGRNRYTYLNL